MSYDLSFWRGKADMAPVDVYRRLNKNIDVQGIRALSLEEIQKAFRAEFPDLKDGGPELLGPGFSVMLPFRPIKMITVCCAWGLVKNPAVLEKIEQAGYRLLRCNRYNPQIDEFKEHPDALDLKSANQE